MTKPHYVGITGAARLLGVSQQMASRLYRTGKLPEPDAYVDDKRAANDNKKALWEETRMEFFAKQRKALSDKTPRGETFIWPSPDEIESNDQ